MKRNFILLLIGALLFSTATICNAQIKSKASPKEGTSSTTQMAPRSSGSSGDNTGLYVNIRGGYYTNAINEVLTTQIIRDVGGGWDQFSFSNEYATLGDGLNFGAAIGYMFNDHFGVELNAHYYMTNEHRVDVTQFTGLTDESFVYSRQIRTLLSFICAGNGDVVRPYTRFGLLVPVGGSVTLSRKVSDRTGGGIVTGIPNLDAEVDVLATTVGNPSVGFNGAVGLTFGLSDNVLLFGEAALEALTVKTKATELTKFNVDVFSNITGEEIPTLSQSIEKGSFSYGELNINYVDQINQNSNWAENPNTGAENPNFNGDIAEDALARKGNYNAVGLNIGLRFRF